MLKQFRFVRELYDFRKQYELNCNTPPGHFYNPVLNLQEIRDRAAVIWPHCIPNSIPGIDLHVAYQLEWVKTMIGFYPEIPFTEHATPGLRYYYENQYYSYTDAIMLYTFYRKLQPKKVIEVGSGFSSAVMLDARDLLGYDTQFTFIDPDTTRLQQLLSKTDQSKSTIMAQPVQEVNPVCFEALESGDILFIDGSHVLKTGSDVHYTLCTILPKLKPGVFIHFHDVFYPFEYPQEWILNGTNWNELYAIQNFLMYNQAFSIAFFSHYLHLQHAGSFDGAEKTKRNFGGNLWLRKN